MKRRPLRLLALFSALSLLACGDRSAETAVARAEAPAVVETPTPDAVDRAKGDSSPRAAKDAVADGSGVSALVGASGAGRVADVFAAAQKAETTSGLRVEKAAAPQQRPAPSRAPKGLTVRGQGAGGGGTADIGALGIGGLATRGRSTGERMRASASAANNKRRTHRKVMLSARKPMPAPMPTPEPEVARERFEHAGVNPWVDTKQDKLSTFAIDVDTASYTFARRFMERGQRPNPSSVRVEEWVNAFHYDYADPETGPFTIHLAAAPSPVHKGKHLVRVGIQGKHIENSKRKPVHLTFLVDVSGSMSRTDKLPLAKKSLHLLVEQLRDDDSVALVTYAGATREVLAQTSAKEKGTIHAAIEDLRPGGGTAMGTGMEMAYRNANKVLSSDSVSRVIVLSDGDANIGRTSHKEILKAVKGYVSEGVTLSTVGFGTGNYQDHLMEQLADAGNGNYSYIDSMQAARKVFVKDLVGTLQVIAKDVKIQVEFDDDVVKRYRLVGYENRDVADKDFRNDKVDAGEIGAGHTVTALYEVELKDPRGSANDLGTVRVRAKTPRGTRAQETAVAFTAGHAKDRFGDLDADTRFAFATALAAEILRGSGHVEGLSLEDAYSLAAEAIEGPYVDERKAFVNLLGRLTGQGPLAIR